MRFAMVLLMALAMTVVAAAGGAEETAPTPRVRVTAPSLSGKRLVGRLLALDDTTLTLLQNGAESPLRVPRSAIARVEVSRRPSRKAYGAGVGMLAGLVFAAAIGLGAGDDCGRPAYWLCFSHTAVATGSAVLTVPAGALLGWAAAPGERWDATEVSQLRVVVAPTRGGLQAGFSVSF